MKVIKRMMMMMIIIIIINIEEANIRPYCNKLIYITTKTFINSCWVAEFLIKFRKAHTAVHADVSLNPTTHYVQIHIHTHIHT